MRTEKQKMLAGELYRAADPELRANLAETRAWLTRYNRAESAEDVKAALARPEVASVLVPETKRKLLDLDLTELTYG